MPSEAMQTFDFGAGPVPAKRHRNPNGSEGGWVANTVYVAPTVVVEINACVYDYAAIHDQARILDRARIYEWSNVCGNSVVYGDAQVFGEAQIRNHTALCGKTVVCGQTSLDGFDFVNKNAYITCNEDFITLRVINRWVRCFPDINRVWFIQVGCQHHTLDYWEENLPALAAENYLSEHVKIGKQTITFIKALIASNEEIRNRAKE